MPSPVSYKVLEYDIGPTILKTLSSKLKPEDIVVRPPQKYMLEFFLEMDRKDLDELRTNALYLQNLQTVAKAAVKDNARQLGLVFADFNIAFAKGKYPQLQTKKQLEDYMKKMVDRYEIQAIKDADAACTKTLTDLAKRQKKLKAWRIKTGIHIGESAGLIASTVAVAGGTFGAGTPLAVYGVIKGGISIAQDMRSLFIDADTQAKLCVAQQTMLEKIFTSKDPKAMEAWEKWVETGKDTLLRVASDAAGIDMVPSIENFEKHLTTHKMATQKAEDKAISWSRSINKALDAQEAWHKAWQTYLGSTPSAKGKKLMAEYEKTLRATQNSLDKCKKYVEAVQRANERQKDFDKALDGFKKRSYPTVAKWTSKAIGLGLDIAEGKALLEPEEFTTDSIKAAEKFVLDNWKDAAKDIQKLSGK
jgi:hypothetical protein